MEARCRGWENGWRRHICGGMGSKGNHEWRERQLVDGMVESERGKRAEERQIERERGTEGEGEREFMRTSVSAR